MKKSLILAAALAMAAVVQSVPASADGARERAWQEVNDRRGSGHWRDDDDDDDRRDYRHDRRDWRHDRRDHRDDRRDWRRDRHHSHGYHDPRWQSRDRYVPRGNAWGHTNYRNPHFRSWSEVTPGWVHQYYGERPGWRWSGNRWVADRWVYDQAWSNVYRPRVIVGHQWQQWNGYGYNPHSGPHVAWYRSHPDYVWVNGRQRPYYYDQRRSAYYTRDDDNAEILLGVAVAAVGLALLFGN